MRALRALAGLAGAVLLAAALLSGGSDSDPSTPAALPGLPPPFLGTAVAGSGGLTAAIDSYGNVVDLRVPGPAGTARIDNSYERQSAGTVPGNTGIVVAAGVGEGDPRPLWEARTVEQGYRPGTNVVVTTAALDGGGRLRIEDSAPASAEILVRRLTLTGPAGQALSLSIRVNLTDGSPARCVASEGGRAAGSTGPDGTINLTGSGRLDTELDCAFGKSTEVYGIGADIRTETQRDRAGAADRRWLAAGVRLGPGAPPWARALYERSLLVLRALTDRRTGAVAAGARDGWAYVWPRDAATVALALKASGHEGMATRIARFLDGVDLGAAARFYGDGEPVPGRPAQGDAVGWRRGADHAGGLPARRGAATWRGLADYGERSGDDGDYLANAIAAGVPAARIEREFGAGDHLVRIAGEESSTLDAAVGWAVVPFPRPALRNEVTASLRRVLASRGPYGITPSLDWPGGPEPWAAPTAWVAWSFAALGRRADALTMLASLRRAATPAGVLPERVDAETGIPESTTPLVWPHAFAVLALTELWPPLRSAGPDRPDTLNPW